MNVSLADGSTAVRVLDIVARKSINQPLSSSKLIEIKTFAKPKKRGIVGTVLRKLNRLQDILEAGKLIGRTASLYDQMNKDAALFTYGGTTQGRGEEVSGTPVEWVVYDYKKGKNPKRAPGPGIPIIPSKEVLNKLNKAGEQLKK